MKQTKTLHDGFYDELYGTIKNIYKYIYVQQYN